MQLLNVKREGWLHYLNCLPDVMFLLVFYDFFLTVQWVDLLCVIMSFPGHTHLFFLSECLFVYKLVRIQNFAISEVKFHLETLHMESSWVEGTE